MCGQNEPADIDIMSGKQALENDSLIIPEYQRIYCWGEKDIHQLWQSLYDGDGINLGSIILYQNGEGQYEIVDGQQRLITLVLIAQRLGEISPLLQRKARTIEEKTNIANALWVIDNLLALASKEEREEIKKILASFNLLRSLLPGLTMILLTCFLITRTPRVLSSRTMTC